MTKRLLFIVIVLSFLIRIINLNYPPLLWDEASLGYNAYSILKTGRDEYGQILPLVFKSFGDYKPGFYVYLTVPFVALLGLNPVAVRLPSVTLGSLLPLIVYLLIKKLSPKSTFLALLTAALLAFNPWNIHFSRGAWETNVLLFELMLASWLFLDRRLLLSSLVFSLSLYTYQGGKILVPLAVLILLIVSRLKIFSRKLLATFFLPIFILSLPLLIGIFTGPSANRLSVFALWSYTRPQSETDQIILESNSFNYLVFHNGFIYFIRNFFMRYFNHFSFRFLIFEGDWQVFRHGAPYIGMLLYPSALLFILGILSALAAGLNSLTLFFLMWLVLSPLPAALTRDIIQPVRALTMSVPLVFFAAAGAQKLLSFFKSRFWSLGFGAVLFIIYLLSFVYYSDLYYNHMTKVRPDDWLYGYQPAMSYALNHSTGKSVTFTDFYGQPYIYYLFLSRLNPASYQKQANLISSGPDVGKIAKINNFNFSTPNFSALKQLPGQLIILSYDDALRQGIDLNTLTPLSPVNGHSTFYAYETD